MPEFQTKGFKKVKVHAKQWFPGRNIKGVKAFSSDYAVIDKGDFELKVLPGDFVVSMSTGLMPVSPWIFSRIYEAA